MFDVINTTLSSAVASAGTFTVAYPTDRSVGDYTGAHAHKMVAIGAVFSAPNDFTVAFGATLITVTYNGSTTLPVGASVRLQVDRLGTDDGQPEGVVLPSNMKDASLHLIDLGSPDVADANGIIESQDLTALGVFSVDTTAAAAIAAAALGGAMDVPRALVAAWTTTAVLTITGTDGEGNAIVESSASGTSHTGTKAFKTVTNVSSSEDITGLTVGTGDVLGLPVYIPNAGYVVGEFEDGAPLVQAPPKVYIPFEIDGTKYAAGTSEYVISPIAGEITSVQTVAAVQTAGAGAITLELATVAVDGLSVVIADASAVGTLDSDTPTAGHATAQVTAGAAIEIVSDGTPTAGHIRGFIEVTPTAAERINGALVAGVTSKATATTGDVRGTYNPTTACDGSTAFALLAALPDPGNKGVPQYAG